MIYNINAIHLYKHGNEKKTNPQYDTTHKVVNRKAWIFLNGKAFQIMLDVA